MAYTGLFFSALLAATLLPVQSEAILVTLITQDYSLTGLLIAATLGNTLGAVINWCLGICLNRFQNRRWFPVSPESLERAQVRYARYGYASLLLSWVPIIGDPLTLIAGVMRTPLHIFLPLVLMAKAGRYGVLAWLTLKLV